MKATSVVVEIDGPLNENLIFRPLGKRVRGRFDPRRMPDPGKLQQKFPTGIPGQRLGCDFAAGQGFIEEPLHAPEHATVRAAVAKYGALPPERETFPAHAPTWYFWLRGACDCGLAHVVEGAFPDAPQGEPVTEFITSKRPDPLTGLAAAIREQTAVLSLLLDKLAK